MSPQVAEGRVETRADARSDLRSQRRLAGSAIAVMVVIIVLMVLVPTQRRGAAGTPSSFKPGPHDFLAFARVLDSLGIPRVPHLSSYGVLPDAETHLLVTLSPGQQGPRELMGGVSPAGEDQQRELRFWIESGGHWLLALPDRWRVKKPEQPPGDQDLAWGDGLLSELPGRSRVTSEGQLYGNGPLQDLLRRLRTPRWLGDREVEFAAFMQADESWTTLLDLEDRPLALTRPMGDGQVTVVSSAALFDNVGLGALDTGSVAVRLLLTAAEGGARTAVIDEFTHGIVHDRGLWWTVRQLGFGPALLAAAILLCFLAWRGGVRRLPVKEPELSSRRSTDEFVVALADIARRAYHCRQSALQLIDGHELLARRAGDRESLRKLRELRDSVAAKPDLSPAELVQTARAVDRIHESSTLHSSKTGAPS